VCRSPESFFCRCVERNGVTYRHWGHGVWVSLAESQGTSSGLGWRMALQPLRLLGRAGVSDHILSLVDI
jgi:hypothetical protein